MSRTEAAARCGLSPATITLIAAELQRAGLLVEGAPPSPNTGPGRPRRSLGLAPGRADIGAVAVTHRGIGFARADYALGKVERWTTRPELQALDAAGLASHVAEAFDSRPDVLVVGVQGAVSNDGRSIVWSPVLPAASGALGDAIEARGFPWVVTDNDCALIAGVLPEAVSGLEPPFCTILASYGIGAAVVGADGILRGTRSSALELGHVPFRPDGRPCRCGRRGCVEAYAADYAVWAAASALAPGLSTTPRGTEQLLAAAAENPALGEVIDEATEALGTGIAALFALLDPMPVIVVGEGAGIFATRPSALRKAIRAHTPPLGDWDVAFLDRPADEMVLEGALARGAALLDQALAQNPFR